MKSKILATVSAIALMASLPAWAETKSTSTAPSTGSVSKDVENAWEDIKDDTSETYENIKATFIDDTATPRGVVTIDTRMTAAGMIGKPVYNGSNQRVGTVKDIILEPNHNASMIIVADGEFPGFSGKLVAFNYDSIARRSTDGDFIMPLTEDTIDNAAEFSYDRKAGSDKVRVIPDSGYSVAELLDSELLNQKKDTIAQVDNISFRNGRADQLIVVFDQVLGLGGEKAAFTYGDAKVVRDGDGDPDFQLSANQSAQFEDYKKTATN